MAWRIAVHFPEGPDDLANGFTSRVGNLQEAIYAKLQAVGGGSIALEDLDRIGHAFNVSVPKRRDVKSIVKLVERVAGAHIPERSPTVDAVKV